MTLSPLLGYALMIGLGAGLLAVALVVRTLISSTRDFIIAGRQIGFGYGVGALIAVWTWSMAVMMSSAQAFSFGTSGLVWFVVPNGLAVILMVPFAVALRRRMPEGYTIVEFVRHRFESPVASAVILLVMIAVIICEVLINLFGIVLVMGVVFGLQATAVLVVALVVVTVYSYFGGLWTSAVTGTIGTLCITVPAALITLYALAKAGGASTVFKGVEEAGGANLDPVDSTAASAFGISLALGLLASTMADQTFWQKAWSMKPASMSRTFLWAGLWFYPIPLCMGLFGLIGISQGVTMEDLGADGAGAIGPYVITHLGIPTVLVALYVTIILQACYSTIDGAFSALSSLVATDVVKPRWPQMPDKQLLRITKGSIIAGGVLGGIVVLASNDYINTVNTIYFFKGALILPLTFAIFWKRTTAPAFVASIFVAAIAGYLVRENVDELWGTATLLSSSLLVLILGSAFSRSTFDYAQLERVNRDDTPEPVLTAKADRS
ncbi:sodium:solute symporter family transporter [Nocardioides lijunqiniae]|uniref:sodium:solute symporter family transporter n=1 Tax=Nocardioides lijunqiniae TaxID=2760832 RepID=UPI001D0CDCDF|nr:hypothetical protein [Nocardioides lijunqiniae]